MDISYQMGHVSLPNPRTPTVKTIIITFVLHAMQDIWLSMENAWYRTLSAEQLT